MQSGILHDTWVAFIQKSLMVIYYLVVGNTLPFCIYLVNLCTHVCSKVIAKPLTLILEGPGSYNVNAIAYSDAHGKCYAFSKLVGIVPIVELLWPLASDSER